MNSSDESRSPVDDLVWRVGSITLRFRADDAGPVRLVDITTEQTSGFPVSFERAHQPLVEVLTPQFGNETSSNSGRHSGTTLGRALRYLAHEDTRAGGIDRLKITQRDPTTGLTAVSIFEALGAVPAVRTTTELSVDEDSDPLVLWAVTSFATGAVISTDVNSLNVWRGASSWAAENRWTSQPLRAPGLVETDPSARGETSRSCIRTVSTSSWSSGAYVPAGAIQQASTGRTLAWQVEHNGAWLWEVGERPNWTTLLENLSIQRKDATGRPTEDRSADGAYVAVLGPTDAFHQWSYTLTAAQSFTAVPVTFTIADSFDHAFGQLTQHRRAARRTHPQDSKLPVVFNDYMNTLEGDPTEAKLLPLIHAAADVGCEYFCIDAGWYDDTAGWWASVGDWIPSTRRFPQGLAFLLDQIRARNMVPGLWLEPEVVGISSEAVSMLPDEAFLQRGGVRIRERERYLLDLRSTAARAHLDAAVDRLVTELGVGYFKLDYNVTPGPGTDYAAPSVGHGLLEHNRALLSWLDSVLDRHPELILENCGSGAMRSDFAMLSRLQLQSTSDQQDPLLYPAIAVGALVHILSEQAGNWAYPQATMTDEMISFTMCTGMAGRLYQAGLLNLMSDEQLSLVADGVRIHKSTRHALGQAEPIFPTGLPTWNDAWVTVAFRQEPDVYVLAWRQAHAAADITLDLPGLDGPNMQIAQIYPPPERLPEWTTNLTSGGLRIRSPEGVAAARFLKLTNRAS
jgi:alpha-galactosidase